MKGASEFDRLCHRVFDGNGDGEDYLARATDIFCCRCGHRVYAYYCEERLFLVECDGCRKKVLVKAGNRGEAAHRAFGGGL